MVESLETWSYGLVRRGMQGEIDVTVKHLSTWGQPTVHKRGEEE